MNLLNRPARQVKQGKFTSQEWLMLVSLMLPTGLDLINAGMLSVALPVIQSEFKISVDVLSLVVASGFLMRVTLMPIYGQIGDAVGKKRSFIMGLTLFLLGTLICLISPTFFWLIVGCVLQGVGGAAVPLAIAIIVNTISEEKRNRAIGIVNSSGPAFNVFGPVVGGFLIVGFGWRAIFIIIILITTLALILGNRFIPKEQSSGHPNKNYDWLGAFYLTLSIAFFLLSIMTQSLFPFGSPINVVFFIMGGASILLFIWHSLKTSNPFVELSIINNQQFTASSFATGLRMFALSGSNFLLILFLANIYNLIPSSIGTLLIVFRLALMVGIMYSGTIADRWSSRSIGMACLFIQAVGIVLMSQVIPVPYYIGLFSGMIFEGLAAGLCLVAFTKEAITSLGILRVGLATGLFNTIRFSGVALSAPILGLLLDNIFSQHGGSQTVVEGYKAGFFVLFFAALLGVIASKFIPLSTNKRAAY